MGIRDRLRRDRPGTLRGARDEDVEHLEAFAANRRGVEGFVEPQTPTTATTLVLVAGDGEWTRRRVASREAAFDLGRRLAVPVYDVAATGYPSRMRAWTAARKAAGEPRSQ
ncbi:MAG: oxidoreductase [Pseudorhodobacter sp.]|nr:oxidoreductase [Frankiaceae bacterium]